jgi:hypothetical protein
VKTSRQLQTFLEYRDQHVYADRDPDLRLDRVLAGAQKGLDPKVLLDPFEEQLDLPLLSIVYGNHLMGEHAGLIGDDLCVRAIDWQGASPLKLCVGLDSRDKERLRLMNGIKPLVVEVATIRQIERPWLDNKIVQHVDLMSLAVRNTDKAWDRALQVEQPMEFDRTLCSTKRYPRINRQAQIVRGRIKHTNRCVQIDTERLVGTKRPRNPNQMLSVIGIDLPWTRRIRIGQRIARKRRASKSHVVQMLSLSAQIDFDIAKRLPICQLNKAHREELKQACGVFDLVIVTIRGDAMSKSYQKQMHHDLRENEFALVHEGSPLGSPREVANNPKSA